MDEQIEESLQTILSAYPQGIAQLLRSAAHPARIQILTILSNGEHEFSKLMQKTELSKTALANHIHNLVDKGLVQKTGRGEYSIADDGQRLLTAAVAIYKDSAQRKLDRLEEIAGRYTSGLVQTEAPTRGMIRSKADFQPCWLSYTGAVAGALRALGVDCDTVDVGGYSGYAFLINVAKGDLSPSGPTGLRDETWDQIHKGTESLGWSLDHYTFSCFYPKVKGSPTPEEIEAARKLFERIKQEIDRKHRPVVLWGLAAPEYGIVNGYDGDFYITSTFRSHALLEINRRPERPVLFYNLDAPSGIHALFFKNQIRTNSESVDKKALERAIRFASAKIHVANYYIAGSEALDSWANDLENLPEEKLNYMGNSYVGACVAEGRWMAGEFLKRLARRSHVKKPRFLLEASQCYEKGARLMKEFTQIFPFKYHDSIARKDRKRGSEILRKVKSLEEKASLHMKEAL